MKATLMTRTFLAAAVLLIGACAGDPVPRTSTEKASTTLWDEYIELLRGANHIQAHSTVQQDPAQAAQYLFMTLAHAYALITRSNPDYPEFVPYINHVYNIAGPNPDTTYHWATIDGKNAYRISGQAGSVHMIDFQIGYDFMGFSDTPGRTLFAGSFEDVAIGPDGWFEIRLSTERPADFEGNWFPLDERANYVMVRQVAYDPGEVNARLAIENLGDAPYRAPKIDADRAIRESIAYTRRNSIQFLSFLKPLAADNIVNRFVVPNWSTVGGLKNQTYIHGLYDVAGDEALLVEVELPQECLYWNMQATDRLWQTLDFMRSQSYLNGHVDRTDSDGLIRIVLSHQDPGTANWIDLNAIEQGYMLMRTIQCDPVQDPSATKVPVADIEKRLPSDTARITPDQRRMTQRRFATALQLRHNW